MSILTPRRYYLAKRIAAIALYDDSVRAGLWRAKQEALAWPDLPAGFPGRAVLMAAGYTTVRDLDDADITELTGLGLNGATAQRVLAAMENWKMITLALLSPAYQRQDGKFASVFNAPLLPSVARTATVVSDTLEMGDLDTLRLLLDVTAASGTLPTLDVIVETSHDGATNWQRLGTFAQKTAVSNERQVFPGADRFVRATATITGTLPSITFSLMGEAC